MAPAKQGVYDATARAAELAPTKVTVEGVTYTVKRSGKALRQIIELTPENAEDLKPVENIELLYKSIAVLLVDEAGNHPDPEGLEDDLDFEVAQEMMEKFVPRARGGDEEENPTQNGTVTDSSEST